MQSAGLEAHSLILASVMGRGSRVAARVPPLHETFDGGFNLRLLFSFWEIRCAVPADMQSGME